MPPFLKLLLPPIVFGFGAFGLASFLTGRAIGFAEARGWMDQPNERSSHRSPTPRVGGIGFVGAVLAGFLAYQFLSEPIHGLVGLTGWEKDHLPWGAFGGVVAALLLAFGLGLWDDRGDPPAIWKLAGQIVIALIPPLCGLSLRQLQIPYVGFVDLPPVAGGALSFLWVLLMMNVVNFMDGINGLSGRLAQFVGGVILVVSVNRAWCYELAMFSAVLIGSATGFLRWNFPKARTFLGDCGSQPLGLLVAVIILMWSTNELFWQDTAGRPIKAYDPFLAGVILVSPFVFDVVYTLIRRTLRGENVMKAHREHLYQRYLIAKGEDHVATLRMMEGMLWASSIIAVLYHGALLGGAATPENPRDAFRFLCLMAMAGTLGLFVYRVRTAERMREEAPPAP